MIGRPYKYRGNSPAGFDCSGLVQYSYLAAGLDVPHGTKALMEITLPIDEGMQIGDLLFFNERGKKYSHVGIYLGDDAFVHAPSTGEKSGKTASTTPTGKLLPRGATLPLAQYATPISHSNSCFRLLLTRKI